MSLHDAAVLIVPGPLTVNAPEAGGEYACGGALSAETTKRLSEPMILHEGYAGVVNGTVRQFQQLNYPQG